MNFKCILWLLILSITFVWAGEVEDRQDKVKKGMEVAKDSLYKILFGEPKGQGYKDLFLDTNYNLIDYLNTLEQHITVDDLFLIFFQSLIILSAQKRFDLIPKDFNEKHQAFDDFIKEISRLSGILANKGTKGITLKTLQKFFKTIKSDEFWMDIASLREIVDSQLELEKSKSEL